MLLITQSLISSWGYMFSCWEDGQEQAKEDFMRSLNREPIPANEAMQDGIDFERLCYQIAAGEFTPEFSTDGTTNKSSYGDGEVMGYNKYPKNYSGAEKVAEIIRGGQVQVSIKRPITVDGTRFLIHGILDVLKAGIIYDVKYKVKSFGSLDLAGSYLESPQHPAYFYLVPEAREFQYLVSDGSDLYTEVYTRSNTRHIGDIIAEFQMSIKAMGLFDLYKEKWEVK